MLISSKLQVNGNFFSFKFDVRKVSFPQILREQSIITPPPFFYTQNLTPAKSGGVLVVYKKLSVIGLDENK